MYSLIHPEAIQLSSVSSAERCALMSRSLAIPTLWRINQWPNSQASWIQTEVLTISHQNSFLSPKLVLWGLASPKERTPDPTAQSDFLFLDSNSFGSRTYKSQVRDKRWNFSSLALEPYNNPVMSGRDIKTGWREREWCEVELKIIY